MSFTQPEDLEVEGGSDAERADAVQLAIRTAEMLLGFLAGGSKFRVFR